METDPNRLWLAEELRRSARQVEDGEVNCPNCGEEWRAPATANGGPLVPVRLDKCPHCDWIEPEAAAAFDAYVKARNERWAKYGSKRRPTMRQVLVKAAEKIGFLEKQKKSRKRRG